MESSMDGGLALERRLLKETKRLLTELGLAHSRQALVAAVSGGPDSMALLLLLDRLKQPLGLELHVAHLDHGLRGLESREDARFVEKVALDMDLPVTLGWEDVESYRRDRGLSLEEAAREARYSFLSGVATAQGASAVVLGHTSDDQVETILMHLLRGSGLAGFAGMSPIAYWPSNHHKERVALARPLLDTTKEETAAYCRLRGVTPRQDTSNLSMKLTRNRIRLELLPYLREYNPRIREALLRLSGSAAQDLAYLLEAAGQAVERLAVAGPDRHQGRKGRICRPAPGAETSPAASHISGTHGLHHWTGAQPPGEHGEAGRGKDGQLGRPARRPDVLCGVRLAQTGDRRGRRSILASNSWGAYPVDTRRYHGSGVERQSAAPSGQWQADDGRRASR